MSIQWAGDLESSDVSLGGLGGGYQGDGGQGQGGLGSHSVPCPDGHRSRQFLSLDTTPNCL